MDPQSTYDRIAGHFSSTREYAWPEVESFLASATDGTPARPTLNKPVELAIDIGCGNGRHTESLIEYVDHVVGVDVSRGLLHEARIRADSRGYADATWFVHGDAAALPICDDVIDLGVYVATIHHLRPRSARVRSLNELSRVLRPGGVALVSAWSTAHDRFDREAGFDTTLDWTLPGGETVPRFYHIYAPEEFEADIEASELELRTHQVSSGNCYATVRSPD